VSNDFQKLMLKFTRYHGNSKPFGLIIMIVQSKIGNNNSIILFGSCQAFLGLLPKLVNYAKMLCHNHFVDFFFFNWGLEILCTINDNQLFIYFIMFSHGLQ
jgi:hypothetical protein